MPTEKNPVRNLLILIFLFALGFSLFINIPVVQKEFLVADQATYFSITQSLAYDFDLEYSLQGQDLNRYYRKFGSGPQGIFLKKGKDGKIFFAKSFIYPLFSAPFYRIFGVNGFFVFHTILLMLMVLMGFMYFSIHNTPLLSLSATLTFLFASAAMVYFIWISPDFFNIFMAFTVIFLWLYKHKYKEAKPEETQKKWVTRFLLSDASDFLAAAIAGMAFFSKPPNIILLGPLFAHTLFKKKFVKTAIILLIFIVVTGAFWGTNYLVTGEWNYQGGERKTFYSSDGLGFPIDAKKLTFDNTGDPMTSEGYGLAHLLPAKISVYNFFYYFIGRFSGMIWYFFPAALFLFLFFLRKKSWEQWLILCAISGGILIYIVLMPDNYAGGGGAVANRYFLSIYPLFLFLPGIKRKPKELISIWIMAAIFISPILISPFLHSQNPATHAKKFPFKLLPVEMSLVNNHPTTTNPNAFRQKVGAPEDKAWLYFLDDNFFPKRPEEDGFWTKGDRSCEMILKTWFPVKELRFKLSNNPRASNEITVKVGGETQKITLRKNQHGILSFPIKRVFKMRDNHLYKIKIKASEGSIPYLEYQDNKESRFIGVFFGVEILRKN
ncbi:MAG: hypothetical protein MUP98_07170 [Candidatus Aminicenantes bacterium]|nr:hypothetical protein [Candidatus Aminicenantes bacterium]